MTVQNYICSAQVPKADFTEPRVLGPKGTTRLNSSNPAVVTLGRVQELGMGAAAKLLFSLSNLSYGCCQKPNAGLDDQHRYLCRIKQKNTLDLTQISKSTPTPF